MPIGIERDDRVVSYRSDERGELIGGHCFRSGPGDDLMTNGHTHTRLLAPTFTNEASYRLPSFERHHIEDVLRYGEFDGDVDGRLSSSGRVRCHVSLGELLYGARPFITMIANPLSRTMERSDWTSLPPRPASAVGRPVLDQVGRLGHPVGATAGADVRRTSTVTDRADSTGPSRTPRRKSG